MVINKIFMFLSIKVIDFKVFKKNNIVNFFYFFL